MIIVKIIDVALGGGGTHEKRVYPSCGGGIYCV